MLSLSRIRAPPPTLPICLAFCCPSLAADYKRRSAVATLIKAMVYILDIGLGIPVFVEVVAAWGREPTWLQHPAMSTYFSVATSLGVMVYMFELTYRNGLGYDVWLHHIVSVLATAIALTGVFLAGDELQRALLCSWATCFGFMTAFNAVFYVALFAYHLQLDNYLAKKRLALFFIVSAAVIDRAIVIVPLAYTASSWGLLTVTSKAIMLTIMAGVVPEHFIAARTLWGIYCLNKRRLEEIRESLPVAVMKDPEVYAVNSQGAASEVAT
jgi:hypothetical protein